MQFLNGPEAHQEIKEILSSAKWVRIAVPYWGRSAVSRLGLDVLNTGDVRIVCNLRSGGCNPDEVEKLLGRFGQAVKTADNLHAKLWITDRFVILGSSNASTNGLGMEAGGSEKLIEANVKLTDINHIGHMTKRFDEIYESSNNINKVDISIARKMYNKIIQNSYIIGDSILDAAVSDPAQFEGKDISVWVWNPPPASKEAKEKFTAEKEVRRGKNIDFYEKCGNLKCGQYIIDINPEESPISIGIYKILEDNPRVKISVVGKGSYIHLCTKVEAIGGLDLGDKSRWRAAAKKAAESGKDAWSLSDFARRFLM